MYYLYFPVKDKQDVFRIGVATSKKPEAKPASKPESKPETKSEAQPAGKAEKPRVRLVNGKPVPIQPSSQQPRLF
jgi:hypothetical protein